MIPLGTLVTITPAVGAVADQPLQSLSVGDDRSALPATGFSSGQTMKLMEQIAARTLPPGMGYEWTAMSYQEKIVGNQMYRGVRARHCCWSISCWPASTRAGTRRSR